MVGAASLGMTDFAAWNAALLRVQAAVGVQAIGDALTGALRTIVGFDALFLAALRRDAPPTAPYYSDPNEPGLKYHDGPYLLDPFYNHFLKGGPDGCYRLSELAPEGFARSDYFASYYRLLNLTDELGLLLVLDAHSAAHVSIGRQRLPRFTAQDRARLLAAGPIAQDAIRRMNAVAANQRNDAVALHESLRQAHRKFGSSILTERECEVTQLLLLGNSAKAIARALGISPDTARNHLKRIYPKLGVASQAELFALFFRALERVEPGFDGDPIMRLPPR